MGLDISYKKRKMGIRGVDPRDEYRLLKQVINAYTGQDSKVTHIFIGTDRKVGYSIAVDVKTGIVKYIDDEEDPCYTLNMKEATIETQREKGKDDMEESREELPASWNLSGLQGLRRREHEGTGIAQPVEGRRA